MVFKADAAFALELLALIAATGLLLWAKKSEGVPKGIAVVVAYVSIVAAILTLLCTSYYSIRYWEDGWYKTPFPRHGGMADGCCMGMGGGDGMMGGRGMMRGDGDKCPMMEQKMKMMRENMEQDEGEHNDETKGPGPDDRKGP